MVLHLDAISSFQGKCLQKVSILTEMSGHKTTLTIREKQKKMFHISSACWWVIMLMKDTLEIHYVKQCQRYFWTGGHSWEVALQHMFVFCMTWENSIWWVGVCMCLLKLLEFNKTDGTFEFQHYIVEKKNKTYVASSCQKHTLVCSAQIHV